MLIQTAAARLSCKSVETAHKCSNDRFLSVFEVSWTGLQVSWTGARMCGFSTRNLEHSAANALISGDRVAATTIRLVYTSVHETSHIRGQSMKPGTRRVIATG